MKRRVILVAILFEIFSNHIKAQSGLSAIFKSTAFPIIITGKVIDDSSKSFVPFATVALLQKGEITKVLTCDSLGTFQFIVDTKDIHDSLFNIKVTGIGYEPFAKEFDFRKMKKGENITIAIKHSHFHIENWKYDKPRQ
jgi:hypothetical protein